jgi:uncharacterized membrane protein HdeD (DUF308 family)
MAACVDERRKQMKKDKMVTFVVSLVLLILGIALIIWPEKSLDVVAKGLSVVTICLGIVLLLSYLWNRELRPVSQWKLMIGVALVLVGMFLVPKIGIVLSIIPFILGVLVVCSGISKLLHGLDYRKMGYPSWWVTVVISIAAIILGSIVVVNPFKTVTLAIRVVGVILVFDNFANVFDTLYIGYKLNKDGYVVVDTEDDQIVDIIQKD